jgi:FAD/FMN-containing dehydrogenase
MTTVDIERTFRTAFGGPIVTPSDNEYDTARAIWNGAIDAHPAIIAKCRTAEEIAEAVNLARAAGGDVAIRAGGHSVAGLSATEGGVVIDLSSMRRVIVDPEAATATVEPGATWGDFDLATAAYGLASTGGLVSTTGLAGLTLGGGIGWLQRRYGLACDNLIGADVVTASGEIVHTSEIERPELLWGLRGGGGNFGVVSRFVFTLHPVATVLGGLVLFPFERGREVLATFGDLSDSLPDEGSMLAVVMTAPPEPFVPPGLVGGKAIGIAGCWCGDIDAGIEALSPLRSLQPAVDLFAPMPYPAVQSMLDDTAPPGLRNYFRSGYLDSLSDDVIDVCLDHGAQMPSPMSAIHLHQMGGAVARVQEGDTAFSGRGAAFTYNLVSTWAEESEDALQIAANGVLAAAMTPLSSGRAYVNFLGDDRTDRVRAAYGDVIYDRLVNLKAEYDPANLFHHNQNIPPTG